MASFRLSCIVLSAALASTSLLLAEAKAGPQWAYNMAAHECRLLRKGVAEEEAHQMTVERYPKYQKYIDEYGVGAWVNELMSQCPEQLSTSSEKSDSASKPNSECSLTSSQLYDVSRGVNVTVRGQDCYASFN